MPEIIFRGGYNKYDKESVKNSTLFEYAPLIKKLNDKGKKTCIVTLSKPDGHHYDKLIKEANINNVEIIDSKTRNINWSKYDLLLVLGGDPELLRDRLRKRDFNIKKLKDDAIYVGDSAGAMVLGAYFVNNWPDDKLVMLKGIVHDSKFIVLAHCNNPRYTTKKLIDKVEKFAKKKGLKVLKLDENASVSLKPESLTSA